MPVGVDIGFPVNSVLPHPVLVTVPDVFETPEIFDKRPVYFPSVSVDGRDRGFSELEF